jgi:ABC-type sugar transport system ATPase subunit
MNGVSKRLGGQDVLREVSFAVDDGEFFVLLGASGGGKSTLLKLICGLELPDSGSITLAGRDITRLPPRERNVGMVFQDYGLYPAMNVFDNIAYGLQARHLPPADVRQRVSEAASRLGLGDFLQRSVVDLSGGEQQRVALARALAKDADVYLYDEPLSNLDPKLRFQARRDIVQIHRLKGRPSLYVTHDQHEAFTMADRIGIVGGGTLQQVGTADELLYAPDNLYVARFIGSPPMNLLHGAIEGHDGRLSFVRSGVRFTLPERFNTVLEQHPAREVVLGVRPEAIAPAHDGCLRATVRRLEPLVGETAVQLELAGNLLQALFSDSDGDALQEGDSIPIRFDPERLCLFDATSERALR